MVTHWGLQLTRAKAQQAVHQYPWCAEHHPETASAHLHGVRTLGDMAPARMADGLYWAIPCRPGSLYALMAVDTATGLGFADPVAQADQRHTFLALEHLSAAYGQPLLIVSD